MLRQRRPELYARRVQRRRRQDERRRQSDATYVGEEWQETTPTLLQEEALRELLQLWVVQLDDEDFEGVRQEPEEEQLPLLKKSGGQRYKTSAEIYVILKPYCLSHGSLQ